MKHGKVDKHLINISEIARRVGISQTYASELVRGVKNGPKAQKQLQKIKEEIAKYTKQAA